MNIRISTKGKRPLRSLTPSDKVHAIQRIHDGESKASVARDIGVPESTLRGWCKNEDKLRFMSRQCAAGKMGEELLMDKSGGDANIMGGLQEKRQRLETQMPLNFSNKIKFDELTTFKRNSLTGLDFGGNKSMKDVGTYHAAAAAADYAAFNGSAKNKMFGADVALSTDPSIAAISPLSSLSHLSGLSGLSQSPLAISFTELTSNLNLLAQLNPGLAAMSNLNNLRAGNLKTKTPTHNPRSESAERQTCLSVKNWAKQKPPTPTPSDSSSFELNASQNDVAKSQLKAPNAALMLPQLGANMCALPSLPEDPLLYWLKSQQAILGLNNLYPPAPPTLGAESPPIRSSTPQQQILNASSPPIIPSPLTPSSTPSGSLDDKNSIWFNWYKAFGASLNSLSPAVAAATLQKNSTQETKPCGSNIEALKSMQNQVVAKNEFENILYSQLTKDPYPNPAMQNYLAVEQRNFELAHNVDVTYKPEDLSAKTTTLVKSPLPSPLPTTAPAAEQKRKQNNSNHNSETPSPIQIATEEGDLQESNETKNDVKSSVAECRDVLDSLLYEINNSNNKKNHNINGSHCISSTVSESDSSENSEQNQADECSFMDNNNHNSNKANVEEQDKGGDSNGTEEMDADSREAITHGEKFLQWLENCSNPRVTAVQLMQLRFLITSIKTAVEPKSNAKESYYLSTAIEIDDSSEDSNRSKIRRRK